MGNAVEETILTGLTALVTEFTIGEGKLMTHDTHMESDSGWNPDFIRTSLRRWAATIRRRRRSEALAESWQSARKSEQPSGKLLEKIETLEICQPTLNHTTSHRNREQVNWPTDFFSIDWAPLSGHLAPIHTTNLAERACPSADSSPSDIPYKSGDWFLTFEPSLFGWSGEHASLQSGDGCASVRFWTASVTHIGYRIYIYM